MNVANLLEGVMITALDPVNPADPRGLTYELFKGLPGKQVTYCERNRKAIVGNHFHTGSDPSKNPERMLLLSGSMDILVFDGTTFTKTRVATEGTELGRCCYEIDINSSILHAFLPHTPVRFLEYRETIFNPVESDTYHENSFMGYIRTWRGAPNRQTLKQYLTTIAEFIRS